MPDNGDYAALGELLGRPEHWSDAEARRVQVMRDSQAEAAAAFDQRDQKRVVAMLAVVGQIDEALARWQQSR